MKAESQLLCCHDHTGPLDDRIVMITRCDVVVLLYSIFLGRQRHLQPISLHSGVACFPMWSEGLARFILLLKATPEERAPGMSQDTDQLRISAHKDDTQRQLSVESGGDSQDSNAGYNGDGHGGGQCSWCLDSGGSHRRGDGGGWRLVITAVIALVMMELGDTCDDDDGSDGGDYGDGNHGDGGAAR